MALYKDWDDLNENGLIGDWAFFEGGEPKMMYIAFRYPRPSTETLPEGYHMPDRGHVGHVPITTGEKQAQCWLWDGNREAPTISPSIDIVGVWHGFIRNGELVSA